MKPALWMALVATAAATVFLSTQESADIEPVVRGPADGRSTPPSSVRPLAGNTDKVTAQLAQLGQALQGWAGRKQGAALNAEPSAAVALRTGDMAAWSSQQPPPPPPPPPYKPPPPPPPMAPPFSHAWVGRYVDNVDRAVIAGASQTWVVKVGDVIDGQWRVDAIGERQMTLTFLPLKQTQTVSMK